jgi:hypothetical protein
MSLPQILHAATPVTIAAKARKGAWYIHGQMNSILITPTLDAWLTRVFVARSSGVGMLMMDLEV